MSFPVVLPIDETKNMLDFLFYLNGTKITVMKSDFENAFNEFMNWRNNISATNFSAELFRLMSHADFINAGKFFKGFPEQAIVYSLWENSKTEEQFAAIVKKYILKEGETENEL